MTSVSRGLRRQDAQLLPGHASVADSAAIGDGDAAGARELLESLDDAMFEALGGSEAALARARELWGRALTTLGRDVIDESREQYVRFAVEVTYRFEAREVRDPTAAIAALEIMELVTRGC